MFKQSFTIHLSLLLYGLTVTALAFPIKDKRNPAIDIGDPPSKIHLEIDINNDGAADLLLETLEPPKNCQRWFSSTNLYLIDEEGKTIVEKYKIFKVFSDAHTLWCNGVLYAQGVGSNYGESFGMDFDTFNGTGQFELIIELQQGGFGRLMGEVIKKGLGWPGA